MIYPSYRKHREKSSLLKGNPTLRWQMKSVRLSCVVPTILFEMLKAARLVEKNEENYAKILDTNRKENLVMYELEVTHMEVR